MSVSFLSKIAYIGRFKVDASLKRRTRWKLRAQIQNLAKLCQVATYSLQNKQISQS